MKSYSRLRVTATLLVITCLLYFIVGGVLVLIGWIPVDKYAAIGGIVGGIASVLSLISLARPALNREDLGAMELETLKKIAETSEQINQLENAKMEAKQEIGNLELQKKQMEFLVQKASLSLFLREQKRLYDEKILEELGKSPDLKKHLSELASIEERLEVLEEEIERDPNVELLQKIIKAARRREIVSEIQHPMQVIAKDTLRMIRRIMIP